MEGARHPGTIVVAGRSAADRELLASFLTVEGFTVFTADNSRGALELIRTHEPSAALIDLEMPDRSGIWLLQQVRSDPDLAEIPVLFLTSRAEPDRVRAGLEFGAHDYIRMPAGLGELLARVRGAVQLDRTRRELVLVRAELATARRADRLTGLPDREGLRHHLREGGGMPSVIMLGIADLDGANAEFGFDNVDAVLLDVAERLRAGRAPGFVLGRWNDSTFVAVAQSRTDTAGLEVVAERMRSTVAGRPYFTPVGTLRLSVTVAVASGPGRPEDILLRAAARLASAKVLASVTASAASMPEPGSTALVAPVSAIHDQSMARPRSLTVTAAVTGVTLP